MESLSRMRHWALLGALLLLGLSSYGGSTPPGENGGGAGIHWTRRSASLLGVVHGRNTFVAVGRWGTILTSPDGASWTPRTTLGMDGSLFAVTYGNGTFVAVGEYGTILTSP